MVRKHGGLSKLYFGMRNNGPQVEQSEMIMTSLPAGAIPMEGQDLTDPDNPYNKLALQQEIKMPGAMTREEEDRINANPSSKEKVILTEHDYLDDSQFNDLFLPGMSKKDSHA